MLVSGVGAVASAALAPSIPFCARAIVYGTFFTPLRRNVPRGDLAWPTVDCVCGARDVGICAAGFCARGAAARASFHRGRRRVWYGV